MTTNTYSLLQTIDDPADLRRLSRAELKTLAQQLRAYVLDSVSKTGGLMLMSLSLRMTSRLASVTPALFSASKAMPAVMAPSPMTAMARRSSPFC